MKKYLQKKLNNEKGMTLIELLAVIVIIAIIAAIAIPAIGNIIENSRYSAVKSDATNVLAASNIYFTENPEEANKTVTVDKLMIDGYLQSAGKFEAIKTAATITKANPNTLEATALTYSGSKQVKFTAASNDAISKDTTKGSVVKTLVTISAANGTVVAQ